MNRCHAIHVTLRHPCAVHGFLPNIELLRELVKVARDAPCTTFLVDAGDALTARAHATARRQQHIADYNRTRLATPAQTFADEQRELATEHAPVAQLQPFVELVLAGNAQLVEWARQRGGTTLHSRPDEVHCHTPLNQRLLPANMRICQWLVDGLATTSNLPANAETPDAVLLAGRAFVALCETLELDRPRREELAGFGHCYLSRYLAWDGHSPQSVLDRRVARIGPAARDRPFIAPATRLDGGWLVDAESQQCWFFPESLWMQYHWFVASLAVPLGREVALTEALHAWSAEST